RFAVLNEIRCAADSQESCAVARVISASQTVEAEVLAGHATGKTDDGRTRVVRSGPSARAQGDDRHRSGRRASTAPALLPSSEYSISLSSTRPSDPSCLVGLAVEARA